MVVATTAVLINAGDHVPVIPLVEVSGSPGAVLFRQSGPIAIKVGIVCALIVTLKVVFVAH